MIVKEGYDHNFNIIKKHDRKDGEEDCGVLSILRPFDPPRKPIDPKNAGKCFDDTDE